jgi:two-component system, NtrC family, response regulator GlrR
MRRPTILLFDLSGNGAFGGLKQVLSGDGAFRLIYQPTPSLETEAVCAHLKSAQAKQRLDAVLLACGPDNHDASLHLVQALNADIAMRPVIVAFEACHEQKLHELLQAGANEFLLAPFDGPHVLPRLRRLLGPVDDMPASVAALKEQLGLQDFIGEDPALLNELRKIEFSARSDAPTLILGETGTGKGLCARAIHYLSARGAGVFVAQNCAAIPRDLFENELFGHMPGAFTGAVQASQGLIGQAAGSTLFLDEVHVLSLDTQAKLLRFLEGGEFRPLGAKQGSTADVHIIAAMNSDPEAAIKGGRLREDFYYRFKLIIRLPPLRERKRDIQLLARHFLAKYAARSKKAGLQLSPAALQTLLGSSWPGNVRQLENVIEEAVHLSTGLSLRPEDLVIQEHSPARTLRNYHAARAIAMTDFDKSFVMNALLASGGNLTQAAQLAGMHRRTLQKLLHKHGITAHPQTWNCPQPSEMRAPPEASPP